MTTSTNNECRLGGERRASAGVSIFAPENFRRSTDTRGDVERDALAIGGGFDGGGPVGAAGHADQQHHAARRAVFDVQLLKRRARRPVVVGLAFERFDRDAAIRSARRRRFRSDGRSDRLGERTRRGGRRLRGWFRRRPRGCPSPSPLPGVPGRGDNRGAMSIRPARPVGRRASAARRPRSLGCRRPARSGSASRRSRCAGL